MLVYLREAHPTDGWAMKGWSTMKDPKNAGARILNAQQCCSKLNFEMTTVTDAMDDRVATRWSGWPERLFVVSKAGNVVYTGEQGPFGFDPTKAYRGFQGRKITVSCEAFLEKWLARPSEAPTTTVSSEGPATLGWPGWKPKKGRRYYE